MKIFFGSGTKKKSHIFVWLGIFMRIGFILVVTKEQRNKMVLFIAHTHTENLFAFDFSVSFSTNNQEICVEWLQQKRGVRMKKPFDASMS